MSTMTNNASAAMKAADAAANSVGNMSASSVDAEAKASVPTSDIPSAVSEEVETKLSHPMNVNKNDVINVIDEAEDLITAVESVAAMYCIPSSSIIGDPTADRLSVTKGSIVVPSDTNIKPSENGKAIIQSIGGVLDYISQRADTKLNQFQANNIKNGINREKVDDMVDPSKGSVVATRFDANDDPVIVYDTGFADMENTKEAHKTYDDMKTQGLVPDIKKSDDGYSYFSDEDDISAGMNISSADNDTKIDTPSGGADMGSTDIPVSTDVSKAIGESVTILDAMSIRNNTRHLGYEILQEQGFSFVKPVDFFTESAKSKKNNEVVKMNINHMKFDNTHLLKAIKLINEVRKEQNVGRGKINISLFINHPKYQEAIDHLNAQFNARLNIRFAKTKTGNGEYTTIYKDIKNNLTISKSKGFQLNGLPIDIFVLNTALDEDAPDDISLFGQHVVSVFCHEIFHNIMAVLKSKEAQFTASLMDTMAIAQDIPSASNRRKLMTNFVNTIDEFEGMKLNVITKRILVKNLTYISTICHDEEALKEYEKAIKNNKIGNIDDQMKRMKKRIRKLKIHRYGPGRYVIPVLLTVWSFMLLSSSPGLVTGLLFGLTGGSLAGTGIVHAIELDTLNKFKNGTIRNYEEHWCDMFAACYNLPVRFFIVGNPRKDPANKFTLDQLNEFGNLEREAYQLMMIHYPTINERNQSAVKYAKRTLDSKAKLDPVIRKYLEWIVANYSKMLDTDIDEIYSKGTFDPKTAEDLDGHIEKLIGSAKITVTESYIPWLFEKDSEDLEYM